MGNICCMPNRCIPGEKYTKEGHSLQEKDVVWASNKPKGEPKDDRLASVQDYVRSDPEVF